MAEYRGAKVYTLEGKSAGTVKEIDSERFTTFKRGITTDEEYRIPVSTISSVEDDGRTITLRLNLTEEQIKHGYEFVKERPNSEFVHGIAKSEPKIPGEKQLIRYESIQEAEEGTVVSTRPPIVSEYLCDMCDEKFASSQYLQKHRAHQHKAPTGI
jgi:hypothetical protein